MATPDLRDCALPETETVKFDSTRNEYFAAWEYSGGEEVTEHIDQTLGDAVGAYDQILRRNAHCGGLAMADYDLFAGATAPHRALRWKADCKLIA